MKTKHVDFISIKEKQIYVTLEKIEKEENKKAVIRGAFMGSGSVNNPEKEYHLEIDVNNEQNLKNLV